MIDMSKDTKHLLVDSFHCRKKLIAELTASLRWKQLFFVDAVVYPGKDIVDVLTCWQSHLLAILIKPSIIEPWSSTHAGTCCTCTMLRHDRIEMIDIGKEFEDIESQPLALFDITWQDNDCRKGTFHQSCADERLTEIQWSGLCQL